MGRHTHVEFPLLLASPLLFASTVSWDIIEFRGNSVPLKTSKFLWSSQQSEDTHRHTHTYIMELIFSHLIQILLSIFNEVLTKYLINWYVCPLLKSMKKWKNIILDIIEFYLEWLHSVMNWCSNYLHHIFRGHKDSGLPRIRNQVAWFLVNSFMHSIQHCL